MRSMSGQPRRTSRAWRVAAALLVAAALAGCGRLARSAFRQPIVALQDVVVKGVGTQGGALDVVLAVENPNDYRLDATRLTYRVYADSLSVAEGAVDQRVTLPEKRTTAVTLPVTFTFRELMAAASVLMRQGAVDYRVVGEVTLATPFGRITRPYEGRGRYTTLPGR